MPRGSFKSTVLATAFPLWMACYNHNIRVLINSETYNNAVKHMGSIKWHIERNEKFRSIYGSFGSKNSSPKWTEDELIINTRTINLKEPTFFCAGLDVTRTGLHVDLIINTDLVSYLNVKTRDQIESVINFYKHQYPILDPGGRMVTEGTVYDEYDLYGHIRLNETEETPCFHRMATEDGLVTGKPLLPDRLTNEFLKKQFKIMGPIYYQRQYNNISVAEEEVPFKRVDAMFYDIAPQGLNICMTVDPAVSLSDDACDSAIIVAGVSQDNKLYVLDTWSSRVLPKDLIDKIFEIYQKWKPVSVGVEAVAYAQMLIHALNDEMRSRGIFMPLCELKGWTNASKHSRIMSLNPRWMAHTVFLRNGKDEKLLGQIIKYRENTKSRVDLFDALVYQLEIQYEPEEETDNDFFKKSETQHLSDNEKSVWSRFDPETIEKKKNKEEHEWEYL